MTTRIPSICTARLTLRSLLPEDVAVLYHIYESDGVLRYFPNSVLPALEKARRFIIEQIVHWERFGYGDWAVVSENHAKMIGWAGLQYLPELDETEVGFLLDRPFWGKGYATEAARATLSFGFERLNLNRIIALVHPENLASTWVIEKCGMSFKETFRCGELS